MKIIAHRGLKKNGVKENTIDAFVAAINDENYVGFELDIRTSKDGVFFVHHDIFVDGEVLSFLDSSVLKETYHLLLLEQVLKLKTDKIILIEIKEANLNVDDFLNLLNRYKMRNIYLYSFDNKVIKKIREKGSFANLGVLNYVFNSDTDYSIYDFIGLLSPIVTVSLLEFFWALKLDVFIYGVLSKVKIGEWEDVFYITDE